MARNVSVDERLIEEAQRLGGYQTKRATVEEALRGYIQRRKQTTIVELFGTIDFTPQYDYKKQRRKR